MKKVFIAGSLLATLSGCASVMNVGSPDYACAGMPEGASCVSARGVYTATDSDSYQTQMQREQQQARANGGKDGEEGAEQTRVLYREQGNNAPIPERAQNPLPIRTQAVVMRIAVDPWEDESGDLHIPGYIYTEIEPRRWEIGHRQTQKSQVLSPLNSN